MVIFFNRKGQFYLTWFLTQTILYLDVLNTISGIKVKYMRKYKWHKWSPEMAILETSPEMSLLKTSLFCSSSLHQSQTAEGTGQSAWKRYFFFGKPETFGFCCHLHSLLTRNSYSDNYTSVLYHQHYYYIFNRLCGCRDILCDCRANGWTRQAGF